MDRVCRLRSRKEAESAAPPAVGDVRNTLMPMSTPAYEVLQRLASLADGARVSVAVNCHFDKGANTLRGWFCKFPPSTPSGRIPFPASMYDGVTVVETRTSETRILELLRDRNNTLRELSRIAEQYTNVKMDDRASWKRCRPRENMPLQNTRAWHPTIAADVLSRFAYVSGDGDRVSISPEAPIELTPDAMIPNYIDQASWEPELSVGGFVGMYHQWYPLKNGKRELKLYLACQSYCGLAGMEIKQIVNDLGPRIDIEKLARSEEAWWLCNVNSRNRRRLLYRIARGMGLCVDTMADPHATGECEMVVPAAETLCSNIYMYEDGSCGVADSCVPTSFVSNGVVCKLSPWEGIGLYSGGRSNDAACPLGTAFGADMNVFPTATVPLGREDEAAARAARLVVHRPSSMSSDFWRDSARSTGVCDERIVTGHASESEHADDCEASLHRQEALGPAVESAAGGFTGVDRAEFYDVALDAWMHAKRVAMRKDAPGGGGGDPFSSPPTSAASQSRQAFVSFTDHFVVSRLASTGWEPQNGFVQLLPMAFYTHQFDAPSA